MIRECQLLLLASYSVSLCVPSWHFPFYSFLQTLVIYSRFLWSFSSREHTVFPRPPQRVVTFKLKQMLSLSSFIHIKIKTAFIYCLLYCEMRSLKLLYFPWQLNHFRVLAQEVTDSEHIRFLFTSGGNWGSEQVLGEIFSWTAPNWMEESKS